MTEIYYCPVCGYGPFSQAYGSVSEIRRSYEICDCCGCEYGYSDNLAHLEKWISEGCPWSVAKARPDDWSLDQQLSHAIRPWPPAER